MMLFEDFDDHKYDKTYMQAVIFLRCNKDFYMQYQWCGEEPMADKVMVSIRTNVIIVKCYDRTSVVCAITTVFQSVYRTKSI